MANEAPKHTPPRTWRAPAGGPTVISPRKPEPAWSGPGVACGGVDAGASLAPDPAFGIGTSTAWARVAPAQLTFPRAVASFSYDTTRTLHLDDRACKAFRNPFLPSVSVPRPARALNLNYGFDRARRGKLGPDRLDALLVALQARADVSPASLAELLRTNILSFRGIMTAFCTALYESRDGLDLNVQLVRISLGCGPFRGRSTQY